MYWRFCVPHGAWYLSFEESQGPSHAPKDLRTSSAPPLLEVQHADRVAAAVEKRRQAQTRAKFNFTIDNMPVAESARTRR